MRWTACGLFVDLERLGKAERQAGRDTFISTHGVEDVGRVKQVLRRSPPDGARQSAARRHARARSTRCWRRAPTC